MAARRPQFVMPAPVDERLERLVEHTRAQGNRVSRSDIVAALIWHAPLDGDALGVMVRQYRRGAQSAIPPTTARRPPGPRPFVINAP